MKPIEKVSGPLRKTTDIEERQYMARTRMARASTGRLGEILSSREKKLRDFKTLQSEDRIKLKYDLDLAGYCPIKEEIFDIGSFVEATITGQVKWTGFSDDVSEPKAVIGIQLDRTCLTVGDGTYSGIRRFKCSEGRAVFIDESLCKLTTKPHQKVKEELQADTEYGRCYIGDIPKWSTFKQQFRSTTEPKPVDILRVEPLVMSKYETVKDSEDKVMTDKVTNEEDKRMSVGGNVCVRIKGDDKFGVIHWIGYISNRLMAGIELDSEVSGGHDGKHPTFGYKFHCAHKRGIYTPYDKVLPDQRKDETSNKILLEESRPETLAIPFYHQGYQHTNPTPIGESIYRPLITSPDQLPQYQTHLYETKEAMVVNSVQPDVVMPTSLDPWRIHTDLMLGSEVEVTQEGQDYYGTVKWIGYTNDPGKPIAGLEMKEATSRGNDGYLGQTRIFQCKSKEALFVLLSQCRAVKKPEEMINNNHLIWTMS